MLEVLEAFSAKRYSTQERRSSRVVPSGRALVGLATPLEAVAVGIPAEIVELKSEAGIADLMSETAAVAEAPAVTVTAVEAVTMSVW